MSDIDPFSQENLDRIFKISAKHPDRLSSRESNQLEFKETFGYRNLKNHIRTVAGFANAKGGYIVYGVASDPHLLIGMKSSEFEQLDPEKITQLLNEYFDPELHWERHIHEIDGKQFGVLYVYESTNKPIVCKKSADDAKHLRASDIYYRYRGRTQVILYPELRQILDDRRQIEQRKWLNLFGSIARIGVNDAALLDLRSGRIQGAGGTIVIDERLLSQIAFIREGEFSETKGKPTLKLIGNVQTTNTVNIRTNGVNKSAITYSVHAAEIILSFLKEEEVKDPRLFLTQIARESTAFLPCYYYLKQAKYTISQAIDEVRTVITTSKSQLKLIERLEDDHKLQVHMPSAKSSKGQRKLALRTHLVAGDISEVAEEELTEILDVVRTLTASEVSSLTPVYLKRLLLTIFNKYYAQQNSTINDKIRRAICYIDWLYYAKEVSS
jgi:hypothetical protein